MKVLSLFTGAGGLDLGLEAAGFRNSGCVEFDDDSKETLRRNRPEWKLAEPGDIFAHRPNELLDMFGLAQGDISVVSGGPPCQPWSKSSYWFNGGPMRLEDPRAATLQAYLNVVEAALPDTVLLENVKGLCYKGKDEGLRLLREGLGQINRRHGTGYDPQVIHINSADYGVPQNRERVFVLAQRGGLHLKLPAPTHSAVGVERGLLPRTTAWDAIGHLDADELCSSLPMQGKWRALLPTIPEGQNYLWHTARGGGEPLFGWRTRYWSFLLKLAKDHPSWTIQAQPGSATGPFHWRNRRLSVEEMCRLQTFPSEYAICGAYGSARRQVGNAVPSAIGELLGLEIRRQFYGRRVRRRLRLIPQHLPEPPAPEPAMPVPEGYLNLRGTHPDHPGTGLGPGAREREGEATPVHEELGAAS